MENTKSGEICYGTKIGNTTFVDNFNIKPWKGRNYEL